MSTSQLDTDQIVINKIAELLPPGQLLSTCKHSPDYNKICHDPNFWKKKVELDYGIKIQLKLNSVSSSDDSKYNLIDKLTGEFSWQHLYINIYENKIFSYEVIWDDQNLGSTYWIPGIIDLISSLKLYLDRLKFKPYIDNNKNELLVQLDSDSVIILTKMLWKNNSKYNYKADRPKIDEQTKKVILLTQDESKYKIIDLILPL